MSYILNLFSNVFKQKDLALVDRQASTTTGNKTAEEEGSSDIAGTGESGADWTETLPPKKEAVIKKCSFCKETTHNILKCEQINIKLEEITEYFSNYENKLNIPNAMDYLLIFDSIIINRYVTKYNIKNYMYHNCSVYYDNNITKCKIQIVNHILAFHAIIKQIDNLIINFI